MVYLPSLQSLFKKPKLNSALSIHILVLYLKSRRSENFFSEWMGITKLLNHVMKPVDADEVDYNGGVYGLDHRVVEDVIKPTMKKRCVLVVNVWGGRKITKVALIIFIPPLLYTPIGWQPIEVAIYFIVL